MVSTTWYRHVSWSSFTQWTILKRTTVHFIKVVHHKCSIILPKFPALGCNTITLTIIWMVVHIDCHACSSRYRTRNSLFLGSIANPWWLYKLNCSLWWLWNDSLNWYLISCPRTFQMTEEQQSNYLYACIFYSILFYYIMRVPVNVFCEACKVNPPPPSLLSGI